MFLNKNGGEIIPTGTKRIGNFVAIPVPIADKYRRQAELARLRRARYETKMQRRKAYKYDQAPFIFWDGEGPQDTGYSLFGNSAGYEICHPQLSTTECLELILECERDMPDAIHVAFGFNYDVSMILKDLSWRHLSMLHRNTRCVWRDWEIEHLPHKWFKVKRGNLQAKIYDGRSFFGGSYVSALLQFDIGTPEEQAIIKAGKKRRAEFAWSEIDDIRAYWKVENKLGPELFSALRKLFGDAGYSPRSWHGPGALARMAFSRHKIYDAMAECPPAVKLAALYAFIGGRFELFWAGHVRGRIYSYDLHSAYPYFATLLPNLNHGSWEQVTIFDPDAHFAVWRIEYHGTHDNFTPGPLPRRTRQGNVSWPRDVEGWFWHPEAMLVTDDKNATIKEGWIFREDDPTNRPFAFLADYYDHRRRLKANGNPAEYTFKLIINAIYGQLAQRAGWDRKNKSAPKTHQLEWAGYITSACRAAIYKAARSAGDKLVSIDTDGIYSLSPIDNLQCGDNLGDWELTEYSDGIFWQSGMYVLKPDLGYGDDYNDWDKSRSRGIPTGAYSASDLLDCIRNNEALSLAKHVFITYGLADNGQMDKRNTWVDEPHTFEMGGGGKRYHVVRKLPGHPRWADTCEKNCHPPLHHLASVEWADPFECMSEPHSLPWMRQDDDDVATMRDFELFDENHLDPDDSWVRKIISETSAEGLVK
jgi:hypothetical protein